MNLISPLSSDSLDLEAIQESIKNDFTENSVISDVDYEGSNVSILTQILAYITYNINATHAMNASQTNLMLSSIRQNIIHEAQSRGYVISRAISSKMSITITVPLSYVNVEIPTWTRFVCGDYIFYNTESVTFSEDSLTKTIDIIEGEYIDYTVDSSLRFEATESQNYVTLNYKNIENDNVYIRKRTNTSAIYSDTYEKVQSLLDIVNDKLYQYEEYNPETEFINVWTYFGGQGNLISSGNEVDVAFLITNGSAANGLTSCVMEEGDVNITIEVNSASRGGTDEEGDESIRNNAPLFINSGQRAVSAVDYNAFLVKNSLVTTAGAWGGESTVPMNLGTVYLSCIPQDTNFRYLTSLEETELLQYLNNKPMIATKRKFKHPNYFEVNIDVKIIGDIYVLDEKKANITTILENYFNTYHNKYVSSIFENKLIRLIETVFSELNDVSVNVSISTRLRLDNELFLQPFIDNYLEIYIPNSPKKYFLAKDGDKINMPENDSDLYSYLANGWEKTILPDEDLGIEFSGTVNAKPITYPATEYVISLDVDGTATDYTYRKIFLDGVEIGFFIKDLNKMYLTDISADVSSTEFIDVEYSPNINIISEKSTVIELGSVTFS